MTVMSMIRGGKKEHPCPQLLGNLSPGTFHSGTFHMARARLVVAQRVAATPTLPQLPSLRCLPSLQGKIVDTVDLGPFGPASLNRTS